MPTPRPSRSPAGLAAIQLLLPDDSNRVAGCIPLYRQQESIKYGLYCFRSCPEQPSTRLQVATCREGSCARRKEESLKCKVYSDHKIGSARGKQQFEEHAEQNAKVRRKKRTYHERAMATFACLHCDRPRHLACSAACETCSLSEQLCLCIGSQTLNDSCKVCLLLSC